jgi:hypothetical protein
MDEETTQHCCPELARNLGQPDQNIVHISPERWQPYADAGWYPGASGPGYYAVELRYDPRFGGRNIIDHTPLAQCPYCGASLT